MRLQKLSCGCVRTLRRLSLALRCRLTVAWSHSNCGSAGKVSSGPNGWTDKGARSPPKSVPGPCSRPHTLVSRRVKAHRTRGARNGIQTRVSPTTEGGSHAEAEEFCDGHSGVGAGGGRERHPVVARQHFDTDHEAEECSPSPS